MLPVVARELSVTARRSGPYRARVIAASIGLVTMFWMLTLARFGGVTQQGQSIFLTLSCLAFVYCLFVGVATTADCISSEKREGTLGLLFLTDLKGYDVAFGKLVSSSIGAVYSVLAMVPVLSLGLLLGGVTLEEVSKAALALANTMFFSLSAGLFVSCVSLNERKAMFATFIVIAGITTLPIVALGFMTEVLERRVSGEFVLGLLLFSPVGTMFTGLSGLIGGGLPLPWAWGFWGSLAWLHLLSWGFLAGAAFILPRVWRDRSSAVKPGHWWARVQRWRKGDPAKNREFRRRMLDQNAFSWLAARDRFKPHFAWGTLVLLTIGWLWLSVRIPELRRDSEYLVVMLFLVNGFFKYWLASESSSRLLEDRRSGGLELFLSTPLDPAGIAKGQELSLRRQFLRPVIVLLGLHLLGLFLLPRGLGAGAPWELGLLYLVMMGMLVLDFWALHWVAMWRSLTERTLNRALLGTLFLVLGLPWIGWFLYMSGVGMLNYFLRVQVSLGLAAFVAVWGGLGLVIDLALGVSARRRFLAEFRERAVARFDLPAPAESQAKTKNKKNKEVPSRDEGKIKGPPATLSEKIPLIPGASIWRRYWIAWVCVGFMAAVLTGLELRQWWFGRALARQVALIRQRGEPVTSADVEKMRPFLPPGRNAADRLFALVPKLTPLYAGKFQRNNSSNVVSKLGRRFPLPAPFEARVAEVAAANAPLLPQLREALNLPSAQFPPSVLGASAIQRFVPLVEWQEAEAVWHLDRNDPQAAWHSVGALFNLGRLLAQESLIQGSYGRNFAVNAALNAVERIFSRTPLAEDDLLVLEKWLDRVEAEVADPQRLQSILIKMRAAQLDLHRGSFSEILSAAGVFMGGPGIPRSLQTGFSLMKQTGEWDRRMLAQLRWYDKALAAASQPLPQSYAQMVLLNQETMSNNRIELNAVLGQVLSAPNAFWAFQAEVNFLGRLRSARAAAALERWRLRTGSANPPETLQVLVPEFLGQLPTRPIDGEPLHYLTQGASYVLSGAASAPIPIWGQGKRQRGAQEVLFEVER